ncbi:Zn(II)2Cys6 transcription factor domain-containing protein, partial [Aspergillus ibericus CBS 121593]
AARSLNGCWTCRVRRKKCDENRPACTRCISLDLECHGYGPRPFWMDNGAMQNEQASKFRHMVSQARSRKRRQKLLLSTLSPSHNPGKDPNDCIQPIPSCMSLKDECHDLPRDSDLATLNSLACSAPSPLQPQSIPTTAGLSIFLEEDYATSSLFSKSMEWVPSSFSPASSVEGLLLTPSLPELHEPGIVWGMASEDLGLTSKSALPDLDDLMWSASLDGPHYQKEAPWTTDLINRKPTSDTHLLATVATCGPATWSTSPSDPTMGGRTEDELLMHYLDRAFYVQYPFYHTRDRQRRGWLLSLLRRVKPAYYASLALSERDLLSTSLSRGELRMRLTELRAKDGYYDLALQGMQRIIAGSFSWHAQTQLANISTACI